MKTNGNAGQPDGTLRDRPDRGWVSGPAHDDEDRITNPSDLEVVAGRLARTTAVSAALVGGVVLAGWVLGVGQVVSVLSNLSTMKANTALAILLAGVGLRLQIPRATSRAADRRGVTIGRLCGVVVTAVAALTLVEYATGLDLGIDQGLITDTLSQGTAIYPGRMGSNTALSLLFVGLALCSLHGRIGVRGIRAADLLGLSAGWIALIALMGYVFSVQSLRGFGSLTQMALHTTVSLMALSCGLVLARPRVGFAALMVGDGAGSYLARRLLPAVVCIPIVLGWIQLAGQRGGYYDIEMSVALLSASHVLLFSVVVCGVAVSLNRADAAQRHTSDALREREERTDFALTAGGVGVWEADARAGTLVWSDTLEAMHGVPPNTFEGTTEAFLARIHPDDREAAQALLEAMPAAATSRLDYRTIWPDGSTHWVAGKGRQFRAGARGPRTIGIGIDITDRKQLETQLAHAQKMEGIGQLAGGVAHDFNNLLTAIVGYTDLLSEGVGPESRLQHDLDQVRRAARRAATLTRQLLAFSRRQVLQPTVIDLNTAVTESMALLERLIGADVDLKLVLNPEPLYVTADPTQLDQVLMNLVVNARDAMPDGGTLTIGTTRATLDSDYAQRHGVAVPPSGVHALLEVTDSGVGMDHDTRQRIFEPFFTTKALGKGTGLGLATTYGIVKQSGGFIWVCSEPGKGSTFKVYLPSTDATGVTVPERAVVAAEVVRGSETVLLVEDEESVRALAGRLLERAGYQVILAADPAAAEQTCADDGLTIHLLVTDVVMQGMSGPELYRRVRERRPGLKVIYMSGYAGDAIVHRGVLDARVAFIQKPFSAVGLTQKVRDVLDA